jgi:dTDP-4-dehydrorhamnose reductase
LITGAEEMLGQAFARICEVRGLPHRLLGRRDIDTAVGFSIEDALDEVQPWAVVNAAEYGRVDDAEREPERCFRENTDGPAVLAAVCARRGIPLVTFSSDRVFDGNRDTPYVEGDPVGPLGVYGRSKAEAEQRVLSVFPGALVVRSGAFFGPWDEEDALTAALRELEAGRSVAAAADRVVSPTYVPDLAHACLDLLMDGETGIWHLANQGAVSPWELVRLAAGRVGLDAARLQGRAVAPPGLLGPRPRFSVLGSERALLLPSLEDALGCYFQDREVAQRDARPRRSRRRAACLS